MKVKVQGNTNDESTPTTKLTIEEMRELYQYRMVPFCCPVCRGQGLVQPGFYSCIGVEAYSYTGMKPEKCRSCAGTGIVWGR